MLSLPCQLQLVTLIAPCHGGWCAPTCVGGLSGARNFWRSSQLQGYWLWLQEYKAGRYCLPGKMEVPRCRPPTCFGIAVCNISPSNQSCSIGAAEPSEFLSTELRDCRCKAVVCEGDQVSVRVPLLCLTLARETRFSYSMILKGVQPEELALGSPWDLGPAPAVWCWSLLREVAGRQELRTKMPPVCPVCLRKIAMWQLTAVHRAAGKPSVEDSEKSQRVDPSVTREARLHLRLFGCLWDIMNSIYFTVPNVFSLPYPPFFSPIN